MGMFVVGGNRIFSPRNDWDLLLIVKGMGQVWPCAGSGKITRDQVGLLIGFQIYTYMFSL